MFNVPMQRGLRLLAPVLLVLGVSVPAEAQRARLLGTPIAVSASGAPTATADAAAPFRSRADSLAWARTREAAHRAPGRRLVVSVRERRLWWMAGTDTLFAAPIAVGKGTRLEYGAQAWDFTTPRGVRKVISKASNPVWTPPDWHYVELARDSAWALVHLQRGAGVRLADGSRVVVRGERIARVRPDGKAEEVPPDEEVIFGDTLFVPPLGTANRRIEGELGAYKLDLGEGYMLHGTPYQDSIGRAATHGCIRLADADIEHLFRNVPVGTPVHIY